MLSQPKINNTKNNNNKLSESSSFPKDINGKFENFGINKLRKISSKTNIIKPKINIVNMINFRNVILPGEDKKIKSKFKKKYTKSVEVWIFLFIYLIVNIYYVDKLFIFFWTFKWIII